MNKIGIIALGLAVLLIFPISGIAGAGSATNHVIDWQVLNGGGAPASAGEVTLNGSLGQTAIGISSADDVNLSSGYWFGRGMMISDGSEEVYLPLIIK